MNILIDADGCPVVDLTLQIAKRFSVPVIILYTGKTKTLTVAIYTEVIRGNYGTAAALSTIMTILTVISLLAFSKLNGGKDISL